MHVANGKNMNEETYKSDEQCVGSTQPIHAQRKICTKVSNLQPGPDVIENRFFCSQSPVRIECEIESNDCGDRHRTAGDNADETFITNASANEPVNRRTRKRGENDQTEE